MRQRRIKVVEAHWTEAVLVCRKCQKKLDGGFGPEGDQTLAKALRREVNRGQSGKGRKALVGVVEVGCLDLCPKGAVVALRASAPGAWRIVPRGADVRKVADVLGFVRSGTTVTA